MGCILIVTHRRGFESDPVIDLLRKRGTEVFRFNCDQGMGVSFASFKFEENTMEFECDNRLISSKNIVAGWCQQLPAYLDQPANTFEHLQNQNLWALNYAQFELLPIPWLNKPSCVLYASNKVVQLALANKIGLAIPKTLISNHPDEIINFSFNQTIVAKNLSTPWIIDKNEIHAAFTKIVPNDWLTDKSALSFSPVIYQQFHERARDFRVVIIGEKVFAASCSSNELQREDVRKGVETGNSYIPCSFDKPTLEKLRFLLEKLSLNYCAADFMEDKNGNLYFLEINTCGAWWWLDSLYEGEICNSITEFLINLS